MIIFTPITQIPEEYLRIKNITQVKLYNLTSYYANAPTLNLLVPSSEFIPLDVLNGDCDTPEFDIAYANQILSNDQAFLQLMEIVHQVYLDPSILVQVLIADSPFRNVISESIMKLIQQRYGYNCYYVNQLEDFLYTDESTFSIQGLFTMMEDEIRWQCISGVVDMSGGD